MLHRFRSLLNHDHAPVHLTGVQLGLAAVLTIGVMLASLSAATASAHLPPPAAHAPLRASVALASVPVATRADTARPDDDVIRLQDLTPEQARLWNAANPVSKLPNPPAKPFNLQAEGVLDEARATDCMTAAVYYEAVNESLDGQRAVAQVVINRLRHPIFPKTVCGVVFQGSERKTGCQFTFTCDGSLAHKPNEEGWARARKVAEAALHGYVMKSVGNATHYHAIYVAPYWSPTLVKVRTIGAHIFYRWTGSSGLPPAFGGRYQGGETTGLQVAKLDNLAKARPALALTPVSEVQPAVAAAAEVAAPARPAEVAAVPAVEAAPAPNVNLAKTEELDWQGRPKAKSPPRLAMPGMGGMGGGMGPGGF